jgi:ergothioneine biosynthesis protein EgtB
MPFPADYSVVRKNSIELCKHLEPEDFVVQSMPDVSPAKWHLAHTTWFFEHFILEPFLQSYCCFDDDYHYLFNSYYVSAGEMHQRPKRGLLSRPLVKEVLQYREHVDEAMRRLLASRSGDPEIGQRVILGLNHEQQHQELMLTDIKHVFSCNPALPAVNPELRLPEVLLGSANRLMNQPAGIFEIGSDSDIFCFDNETPRHETLIQSHAIGSRLVTNGEFLDFIRDDAYGNAALWLSDGWAVVNSRGWKRPLYWSENLESEFTLGGPRELDLQAPVTHVSYYEADAFARWAGCRLPTEFEWELAARDETVMGNLRSAGFWQPVAAEGENRQLFGDVWEWTASPYSPYPGFEPVAGTLGEYNGKFMCNQMTVRGGSCVTADDHIRASYRSFFYPDARWQFLGFRLARDGGAGQ